VSAAPAVTAAMEVASSLGFAADEAVVLHESNKVTVRLLPCDVVARVAPAAQQNARFEIEIAERLAAAGSPVAVPVSGVHQHDGFVVTLWTWYAPAGEVSPAGYARALGRLHAGMRAIDVPAPHVTDRIAEAQRLVADRDHTRALAGADRELLSETLRRGRRMIDERRTPEQLLHGEPHSGNVLATAGGPVFIDFETCCRGPVEFDVAHVPDAVSDHYPDVDRVLLAECRRLVLAMVAAWRWDVHDEFPEGRRHGHDILGTLRRGPPWPTLDAVVS
jgi:aminoglycoside phosphotransferase (APT) family kinase protein